MRVTDEMVEAALKAHYSAWGTAKKSQDMYRDAMRAALEAVIPLSDPAAWQWLDTANFRKAIPESSNPSEWNPLYRHPALSHAAGQEVESFVSCTCHEERQKQLCLNKHRCVRAYPLNTPAVARSEGEES